MNKLLIKGSRPLTGHVDISGMKNAVLPILDGTIIANDVYNGVLTDTDMLGQTLFYGRGAGKLPTAGAVVSDMTDIATHPYDSATAQHWEDGATAELSDPATEVADYMVIVPEAMATGTATTLGAKQLVCCAECGCSAMLLTDTTRAALQAMPQLADAAIYRVISM